MKIRIAYLLFVALVLSSCGGGREEPRASAETASPSPKPTPVPCPLTGEMKPPGTDLDYPALAVKVENSVDARPQAGLEDADIVYEELAEGGITRFIAVYHCTDPSDIGPVRSARSVDTEILVEYAPVLFGYSGANQEVLKKISSTDGIIDLKHGSHGPAYRRVVERKAPHNLFTSAEVLRAQDEAAEVQQGPKVGVVFTQSLPAPSPSPTQTASAPPGQSVAFSFTGPVTPRSIRYTYDPGAGKYLRFHGENAHNSISGKQIAVTNVVILKVKVSQGATRDAAGNYSPEISVVGSGEAYVLRGGVLVKGQWQRSSLKERTKLVDAQGEPIPLLAGNTWFELLPSSQNVIVQ